MSTIKCPYCENEQHIECEDYPHEEYEIVEAQCNRCQKSFGVTMRISYDFDTFQASCMNDGSHDYKKTLTFPPGAARMRCSMCGHERPIKPEERGGV